MKKKIGFGWLVLISLLLISCYDPLPVAVLSRIELVSVWDEEIDSVYEELNLTYKTANTVPLSKLTLKSDLYPELQIFLHPLIRQTSVKTFEGMEEGIRFSFFEPRLPRGRYTLTFTGIAGQERSLNFFLEGIGLSKEDWKGLLEHKRGEKPLISKVDWMKHEKSGRILYVGEWEGHVLLIKK